MGPLWERALAEVALLASEAVSVSAAGAIEMKPAGKAAFMSWVGEVLARSLIDELGGRGGLVGVCAYI